MRRHAARPFGPAGQTAGQRGGAPGLALVVALLAGTAAPQNAPQGDPAPPAAQTPAGAAEASGSGSSDAGDAGSGAQGGVPSQEPAPAGTAGGDNRVAEYEGSPVRSVTIRAVDPSSPLTLATQTYVRNNIRVREGEPFRESVLKEDQRRLNRTGQVSARGVYLQPYDDGSVGVIFEIAEQNTVRDAQPIGNVKVKDDDIQELISPLIGAPVDRYAIDQAVRAIEKLYREKGFYRARVSVDEQSLSQRGVLLFRVREGERVRITSVRFTGNRAYADGLLLRQVETRSAFLFRRGAIDDEQLDRDVASLVRYYESRGHLDVRADWTLRPSPDAREAAVEFLIDEGEVYRLRRVLVEHADARAPDAPAGAGGDRPAAVFGREQVEGLLEVKRGDIAGDNVFRRAPEQVRLAMGKLGYVDAGVRAEPLREPGEPVVDLLLTLTQGERVLTGEVTTSGNDITAEGVILKEMDLQPDRPLDLTRIEDARRQLRVRRLFAPDDGVNITLQPRTIAHPEHRDVLVEVRETNTGEFSIGGTISSDNGAAARIALTQRNFDITDTPDSLGDWFTRAFRGGGQTFQIELMPGNRQQIYSVSLSDPALLDSDYTGSGSIYFRDREFDVYDERRIGGQIGVGRRFGTRWRGNVSLGGEVVGISDIREDRPVDVFDVEGETILPSIGASLTRTTLDDPFDPSAGTRVTLGVEQVGLGVDGNNFTRFTATGSVYVPLRADHLERRTVLSLRSQVGYIPGGQDAAPFFERFYLGGSSLRGLQFRTVSPKGIRNDTGQPGGDPVGGIWQVFAGAQIEQPLIERTLSGVVFVDTGTVEEDVGFDAYRVSVGFGLRVRVPALTPAPLAFDFGFPIVKEPDDDRRLFTFTIDVPF